MIIRVTPDELKNQSNQVLEDINEIEKQWKAIGDIVRGSKNYWQGEAGDMHGGIYADIASDADELIRRLKDNPVRLQMMAGIYDETESAAEAQSAQLPTEVF